MIHRRRNPKRRLLVPIAAAALVLAVAMASAAVWVLYAKPQPIAPDEAAWLPHLSVVPTR